MPTVEHGNREKIEYSQTERQGCCSQQYIAYAGLAVLVNHRAGIVMIPPVFFATSLLNMAHGAYR